MIENLFLCRRQASLREWMDRSDCDPDRLRKTYRYFPVVNRLIARWKSIYDQYIRPEMQPGRSFHLLDVGCGGGDIAEKLCRWALKDGFFLNVTGIDPDYRAIEFARAEVSNLPEIRNRLRFFQTDTATLIKGKTRFDFVVCNHVLHHLESEQLQKFIQDLQTLSLQRVICSDIERSITGYFFFSVATLPFFHGSYIRADGLISIRKSFAFRELEKQLSPPWVIRRQFPFRLLAIYDSTKCLQGFSHSKLSKLSGH